MRIPAWVLAICAGGGEWTLWTDIQLHCFHLTSYLDLLLLPKHERRAPLPPHLPPPAPTLPPQTLTRPPLHPPSPPFPPQPHPPILISHCSLFPSSPPTSTPRLPLFPTGPSLSLLLLFALSSTLYLHTLLDISSTSPLFYAPPFPPFSIFILYLNPLPPSSNITLSFTLSSILFLHPLPPHTTSFLHLHSPPPYSLFTLSFTLSSFFYLYSLCLFFTSSYLFYTRTPVVYLKLYLLPQPPASPLALLHTLCTVPLSYISTLASTFGFILYLHRLTPALPP